MDINLLKEMGISISIHNPLQAKLNREVEHPTWLSIIMGDSAYDYRWMPNSKGDISNVVEVDIFGRKYEINQKFIMFVNRKE